MLSHGAVASRFLGEDIVYEAFADWKTARVRPEVKATLGMLSKLTRQPLEFGPDDLRSLLKLGISPAGIERAVGEAYIFNYQNRMADALGADIPKDKLKRAGAMLSLTSRGSLPDRQGKGEELPWDGRIPPPVEEMVQSVLHGPGDADLEIRQAVFQHAMSYLGFPHEDQPLPKNISPYIDKVIRQASEITDQDIKDLLAEGWSEAEIFEITVSAAVASGYGRLKIAWAALSQAQEFAQEA